MTFEDVVILLLLLLLLLLFFFFFFSFVVLLFILLFLEGVHVAKVDAGDVSDRTHVAGQREFAAVSEVLLLDAREPRDELRRNFTCQPPAQPKIQVRQRGAVREGIQRPCELAAFRKVDSREVRTVREGIQRPADFALL